MYHFGTIMKQGLPTLQRLAVVEAKLEYRRKHLPSRLWHIPTPVATLAAIYHFDVEPIVVIPACWVAIAIAGIVESTFYNRFLKRGLS